MRILDEEEGPIVGFSLVGSVDVEKAVRLACHLTLLDKACFNDCMRH